MDPRDKQIVTAHAAFIVHAVQACRDADHRRQLEPVLEAMRGGTQGDLANVVARILHGERSESLLNGLERDDRVIVDAILRGLQDPASLPDPSARADPAAAAPGLASIIVAAAQGDPQALQALSAMAEQMTAAGGDLARLGGRLRRLMEGERDADLLTQGMGTRGQALMLSLLEEIARLRPH